MRRCRIAVAAALILSAVDRVAAQSSRPLDVPYVSQSEVLCGGAASAMVLRYWGARGVTAEEFAPLVNSRRDGIETRALVDALVQRGSLAFAFTGTIASVTHHLGRRRPVIALIAAAPGRLHYVVIVAVADARVVYHDPAGRPFQTMAIVDFLHAWSASSGWALLVLPADPLTRAATSPERMPPPMLPDDCRPALLRAADAAAQGQLDRAEQLIAAAQAECPAAAAPLRELAGLRLLQRRAAEAVRLARASVDRDPDDRHAWQILGTAEFLQRDHLAALDAWNHAGEPVNDLVRVDGLTRTRHRLVTDRMGVAAGELLTRGGLARARRRLAELPASAASRVEVAPVGGGLAEVHAAVLERPLLPTSRHALGALGVHALVNREATWRVTSPTGGGERLDVSARWWEGRRGASIALRLPVHTRFIGGVAGIEGRVAQESFQSTTAGTALMEDRRSASVWLSDWATASFRWQLSARADRWTGRPAVLGIGGALEHRAGETAAVRIQGDLWPAGGFGAASFGARWRWPPNGVDRLVASATASTASREAPRALWSGAGTGHARPLLLRAHPLLVDGVIAGDAFGRRLVHAGVEWRHELASIGPVKVLLATFADAATATRGDRPTAITHLDAGAGLRVHLPGEGTLRLDYARGIDDGRQAMSVGWELPWPAWP